MCCDVATTVACIMAWYHAMHEGASPLECCLTAIEQERIALLNLQMPTFIRGDEVEDAEVLIYLQPQPTTPE